MPNEPSFLDDNGQPLNRYLGYKRVKERTTDELIGICRTKNLQKKMCLKQIKTQGKLFMKYCCCLVTFPGHLAGELISNS